ncbi:MAG: prepilin peptidase [Chloroflexi bacterium]|nr:prepilin peptidase [Chloroflexota bacterium]
MGLAVASFLNVCIDRLPQGKSILFPASHCDSCGRRLACSDLIPVFSYLWRRGRCRYCQARIPRRVLAVEVGIGALYPLLFWRYGLTADLAIITFYCTLFILIMVIDLEHSLILNKVVYPATGIALLVSLLLRRPEIVPAAIGGGIGLGLFLLIVVVSRGGMGLGDVKMAGLIGLVTGFPHVFVAFFIAIISGGLAAVLLLVLKRKKRKEAIPFGPFLALGAIVTLLWGNAILKWYGGAF